MIKAEKKIERNENKLNIHEQMFVESINDMINCDFTRQTEMKILRFFFFAQIIAKW